ncbi:family 2 glycosyl transferase [Chryseobacterium formosense]|uniref:Family 2 glycosyl transferase n=1 Tax=Chryseobacterium formosense TaxID=236814 RepID=A0A085Z7F7_9FLAO|nr:glycosyltransferase family 2 protein [Chryseobacterium formosense]KFF00371.1 family 2 glycosyl transferase [Chryseobacterium formosense]SFT33318.1 Glycosyltransferase involved in cell wall bisynthesis [Chryseobacterium formosense]
MKISIITVCWNSEKYLKTAIESVLNQTYQNIEYIIIDGGSTDSTLEIIKNYEPLFEGRMKWISEKDGGIYDAMNKGINHTSGDIVGLLNSDDFYISNSVLQKISNAFIRENVDSVYADLYYVKENDTDKIVRSWKIGEKCSFMSGWHPAHPSFFVKKEVYDKFGNFNTDYRIAADFEIMLRFLEKYAISTFYIKEFLLKMRLGGESNKNFKNIKRGKNEILQAFKSNNISVPFYYPYKRWMSKMFQYLFK